MSMIFAVLLLSPSQCPGGFCPPPVVVRSPFAAPTIIASLPSPRSSRPVATAAPRRRRFLPIFRERCR